MLLEMIVLSISMQREYTIKLNNASVMCLHFSMQEEDTLEHTSVKCHLCTFWSTCRSLCNISIHLETMLNVLVPKY